MADDKNRIEKFDGEDFGWWKLQIEDFLCQKDLLAPLTGVKPVAKADETEAARDAAWAVLDRKALGVIRLALTKKIGYHIMKAKSTKEAMEILSNLYEKPSTHNQIFLLRKLVNMKLADRGSVVEHVNKFTQATNQLDTAGVSLENRLQALLFLCSLPDSYNTAVQGITSTCKDKSR
ncbi:retrotransposon gag domain-containing protein [Serratia marcescens]|nr:retrotransposon gag domain-containing protein [Serratia marcescens]